MKKLLVIANVQFLCFLLLGILQNGFWGGVVSVASAVVYILVNIFAYVYDISMEDSKCYDIFISNIIMALVYLPARLLFTNSGLITLLIVAPFVSVCLGFGWLYDDYTVNKAVSNKVENESDEDEEPYEVNDDCI